MKKILIGVCGIGNGHINRQACVINELLKEKIQVVVATQAEKVNILKERFPTLNIIKINIPWITCNEDGIDINNTLNKYKEDKINQYSEFLEFCLKVENIFNGRPDLIISDYEPNVAQYAYLRGVPIITMEQQSKFLYIKEINLNGYSIKEEKARINYFFPKYSKKIISSFFPMNIKDKDIIVVPPIIDKIEKQKCDNTVIVYFSSYSDSKYYDELINTIKDIHDVTFKVYCKNSSIYGKIYNYNNIKFSNYDNEFKSNLSKCRALITTAGHQLISEAISLNIPVYVIPLNTYEQHYNAIMVEKYGLGVYNKNLCKENIVGFLNNENMYIKNICKFKKEYYLNTWEERLCKVVYDLTK